ANLQKQIDSYQRRTSNIDDRSVAARRAIASASGVPEDQLPFAGELMDVAASEAGWRTAAEKALRTLARSILVPGEHLAAVTHAIDQLDGLGRIRWVDMSQTPKPAVAGASDLVSKLE